MIDLRFASNDILKTVDCNKCPEVVKRQRKCKEPGFNNISRGRQIDGSSLKLTFCHGKATWYNEIGELFLECFMAMETGILPDKGSLQDQEQMFTECFPWFVNYFRQREHSGRWQEINEFTGKIFEAVAKMLSKMFGGK